MAESKKQTAGSGSRPFESINLDPDHEYEQSRSYDGASPTLRRLVYSLKKGLTLQTVDLKLYTFSNKYPEHLEKELVKQEFASLLSKLQVRNQKLKQQVKGKGSRLSDVLHDYAELRASRFGQAQSLIATNKKLLIVASQVQKPKTPSQIEPRLVQLKEQNSILTKLLKEAGERRGQLLEQQGQSEQRIKLNMVELSQSSFGAASARAKFLQCQKWKLLLESHLGQYEFEVGQCQSAKQQFERLIGQHRDEEEDHLNQESFLFASTLQERNVRLEASIQRSAQQYISCTKEQSALTQRVDQLRLQLQRMKAKNSSLKQARQEKTQRKKQLQKGKQKLQLQLGEAKAKATSAMTALDDLQKRIKFEQLSRECSQQFENNLNSRSQSLQKQLETHCKQREDGMRRGWEQEKAKHDERMTLLGRRVADQKRLLEEAEEDWQQADREYSSAMKEVADDQRMRTVVRENQSTISKLELSLREEMSRQSKGKQNYRESQRPSQYLAGIEHIVNRLK